jgi:GrpB-like predicted nucleotidyltransferase (UPF0157 family)
MSAVVLVEYSSTWPMIFQHLRDELLSAFAAESIQVEHIGSTAVTGLSAKPVIDVMLGARTLANIEAKIPQLSQQSWTYRPEYEIDLPDRRYFVRSVSGALRVHLHATNLGSQLWRQQLAFRDALRTDAVLRAEYQDLKFLLARQHAEDKSAYTAAKSPFIQTCLARICPGSHQD